VAITDQSLEPRPLYKQVREALIGRLIDGRWPPGQALPSENKLALELGVSQGTVRKALDSLAADNLLVRRQGLGTFVAEPEETGLNFKFFRLTPDDGVARAPTSRLVELTKAPADPDTREALQLAPRGPVWRLARVRFIDDAPAVFETIFLAVARFARLDHMEVPNNLYRLYATRFGVTVAHAVERLKAVAASPEDASHLGCPPSTPLLQVDRVAHGLDDLPVERRISRCLTERAHYLSDLR